MSLQMQYPKCQLCGTPIKEGVKFCPNCGCEISNITAKAIHSAEGDRKAVLIKPSPYRRDVLIGVTISGVITAIIILVGLLCILRMGMQGKSQLLTAIEPPKSLVHRPEPIVLQPPTQPIVPPPQTVQPPPVQVVERQEPQEQKQEEIKREEPQPQGVQQPQQPQQPQVPPDVLAYLRALEKIERQRRGLSTGTGGVFELLAAAVALVQSVQSFNLDEPEASHDAEQAWQRIANGFARYRDAYAQLLIQFRSIRPPASCMQLAICYDAALKEHVKVIRELEVALAKRNITGPLLSLVTVSTRLKLPLKFADTELANICRHFSIPKFFDIGDE